MKQRNSSGGLKFHVPGAMALLIQSGSFPEDFDNPLVIFQFTNGAESLFDTRKGLFLRVPEGVTLPPRDELKSFGKLIQGFRLKIRERSVSSVNLDDHPIEHFTVCS